MLLSDQIAGLLYISFLFLIFKCTGSALRKGSIQKSRLHLRLWRFEPGSSCFERHTGPCHVRPTSVTCPPLSSPAMVPYVCQNVYAVCFFQPDLFLCLVSNEPRSPRGSELKPRAIYTDRTAGALLAKEARVGERNYHGRFRLNQALDNSLCFSLNYFRNRLPPLPSFSPSVFSGLSSVTTSGCVRVSTLDLVCRAVTVSFIHSAAHVPLSNALLNEEAGWAWIDNERLIFLCTVVAPQTLCFCGAGQSRPAVTELSFFCRFPFLPLFS